MPDKHECPYRGMRTERMVGPEVMAFKARWIAVMCGSCGWICDRCKDDAFAGQVDRLVAALGKLGAAEELWDGLRCELAKHLEQEHQMKGRASWMS